MSTETTSAIQRASEIVGGKAALARMVGVKPPTVQQWASGTRPVAVERCVAIEVATRGAVTRKDLRPKDWHLIWPELAGTDDVIKATDDVQPPVATSVKKKAR